jgi:glycine/D-amino acid oxidase-like deaminating enzyme
VRSTPPSLWWATRGPDVDERPALVGDVDCDVAIVGAGFTGLWTARELLRRDPSLRIVLCEREFAGFGASGRNGGWASALYPQPFATVAQHAGSASAQYLTATLQAAVPDLGLALAEDGIAADFAQGGTITLARRPAHVARLRDHLDPGAVWLESDAARARCGATDVLGAQYTPHCARLHPAKAVRGLARTVETLGATIFERTPVARLLPRDHTGRARVITTTGTIRASWVVRATEGYTPDLPGARREVVPLYSLMIATEPQSDAFFDEIGLREYETFADGRHLIIYGQRTADGRLAFGGRGAPYHFGAAVADRFDREPAVFARLFTTLRELFPSLEGAVAYSWGGVLAMPRDHSPFAVTDAQTGLARAGGYTGDGVVLARVAAQALADGIVSPGVATTFSTLPFVQHRSRRWEPEPLRWLGVNAGLALAEQADRTEARGLPSRAATWLDRLLG